MRAAGCGLDLGIHVLFARRELLAVSLLGERSIVGSGGISALVRMGFQQYISFTTSDIQP